MGQRICGMIVRAERLSAQSLQRWNRTACPQAHRTTLDYQQPKGYIAAEEASTATYTDASCDL